jgi:hypothetical protein
MFATAQHKQVWLLLEYSGPWGARATSDNDLPSQVQSWLDAQMETTVDDGRVQFIKRGTAQSPENDLTLFVAIARERQPILYRFTLDNYEALRELSVGSIMTRPHEYESRRWPTPQYLVCTNGKRDRCCALYGLATREALEAAVPDAVWETTHVGGHRFAANVITFPDATYYGRVQEEDAAALVRARTRGEIYLPRLRGRACYDQPVQAADYYLRHEVGATTLDAFTLRSTTTETGDSYGVTFDAADRVSYTLRLQRHLSTLSVYASCGKPQTKPVWQYELLSIQIDEGTSDDHRG